MGFWYADTDDRDGPWHWTGIAISLGQALGLHHDPEADCESQLRVLPTQLQLWRNIWWASYFRDVWVSLGLGRPMRIHSADFDTPMPKKLEDPIGVPESVKTMYLPDGLDNLFESWLDLLKLSKTLGGIMSSLYQTGPTKMSKC
jgi:hypothetical protein